LEWLKVQEIFGKRETQRKTLCKSTEATENERVSE
jgi:hypothetical protein